MGQRQCLALSQALAKRIVVRGWDLESRSTAEQKLTRIVHALYMSHIRLNEGRERFHLIICSFGRFHNEVRAI